jgi:hypothetical protein
MSGSLERPNVWLATVVGGVYICMVPQFSSHYLLVIGFGLVYLSFFYIPNFSWKAIQEGISEKTALLTGRKTSKK